MSDVYGVLGAGSWGTALAVHLARCGRSVLLWGRSEDVVRDIAERGSNRRYLPEVEIPTAVTTTHRLEDLARCRTVLVVVPSHGFRSVLRDFLDVSTVEGDLHVVSAAKGVEADTVARMSEIAFEEAVKADRSVRFAVLSGPTFADEMSAGSPTAAVVAAADAAVAQKLQAELSGRNLRLYSTADVAGVELGGAVKNVVAIAAGVVAGLGFGHNTLAALITRGLHEMTRLGLACGGRARTFSGLAGLGDLVLTCTGSQSRNRQTGEALAAGRTLAEIEAGMTMVAEGVRNAKSVLELARRRAVEMPITEQMEKVLYEGRAVRAAVEDLMSRDLKSETEL
ncbi:MAG: NAD(P)H-dependent glycerol-3-phosphate dehydrogenase [Thermoanaerobaculia bacterium]|nr:NAD(P)H-dependent glycerol-3-phosphate dehydrogenase [Thermoanaerobaculia bacterium]